MLVCVGVANAVDGWRSGRHRRRQPEPARHHTELRCAAALDVPHGQPRPDPRHGLYDNRHVDIMDMSLLVEPDVKPRLADGLNGTSGNLTDLQQDLANFLLTRSPYSWLGWGWDNAPAYRSKSGGCSRPYTFPDEFNLDYGEPAAGAAGLCKETAAGSEVFRREFSKATVQMDCKQWKGSITMK